MHLLQKIPGQGGGAFAAQSLQYGIVGCDGTPGSALGLQQASTFQILQGTLHSVGVYACIGGQLPHGRDTAAWRKFPRHQRQLQLFDQLDIHWPPGGYVPIHGGCLLYDCVKHLIQ